MVPYTPVAEVAALGERQFGPDERTRSYRGAGELPALAYRDIVDSSGAAFLVVSADGTITYVGGSVRDVLGWDPAEVYGRNMAEFLPPDQIELAVTALTELESRGRENGVPIVFSIHKANGEVGAVEIGGVPFVDVPGIEGTVIRMRDWTAQQQLDEFFSALVAEKPLDVVFSHLARSFGASMNAPAAAVLYGYEESSFAGAASYGVPGDLFTLERGPWCTSVRSGEPVNVSATELAPAPDAQLGIKSCWVHPVDVGDECSAALAVLHTEVGPPMLGHRRVQDRLSNYARLALTRSAERDQLRLLAGTDPLTGAMNRAAFRDRVAAALANGSPGLVLAFCDLDGFKPVNDSFGHRAGDAVLVEVVRRLRSAVRRGDVLARFGGDEFTLLFRDSGEEDDSVEAARVAGERLLSSMKDSYSVAGASVRLGLSIGLAVSRAYDTVDLLLARADAALYDAKRAGGACLRVRI